HLLSFVFFFQAEDGIRDFHVTGVQTCALPISSAPWSELASRSLRTCPSASLIAGWMRAAHGSVPYRRCASHIPMTLPGTPGARRSEERRVGKECRSGWSPEQLGVHNGESAEMV